MTAIIRQDFKERDFIQLVREFLSTDFDNSESPEQLIIADAELTKLAPDFVKAIDPYFSEKGEMRYDLMIKRMGEFLSKLSKLIKNSAGDKKKMVAFCHHLADLIERDAEEINVQHLTNTCRSFWFDLRKLSVSK